MDYNVKLAASLGSPVVIIIFIIIGKNKSSVQKHIFSCYLLSAQGFCRRLPT